MIKEKLVCEINFMRDNSVLLAATGGSAAETTEFDRLRSVVLDAIWKGIWTNNHALITSVITVEKITLIASDGKPGKIGLTYPARAVPAASVQSLLTADPSLEFRQPGMIFFTATSKAAFCRGVRVNEKWFGPGKGVATGAADAPEENFWEDFDSGLLDMPLPYLGVLTLEERKKLTEALRSWAKNLPDKPSIGFLGLNGILTPKEVVMEVEKQTSKGQAVLEMLEHVVRLEGLGAVVARLEKTDEHDRPRQQSASH